MTGCTLCDLPTPDPPVTAEHIEGEFCCRGCLEVARTLEDTQPAEADLDPGDVRERLGADANGDNLPEGETETAYLAVEGMHCATCEAFVEGRVTHSEGVVAADASYPSAGVRVEYDPDRVDADDLPGILDGLGYRTHRPDEAGEVRESATSASVGRILVGAFFGMMAMVWYVLGLYPAYLGFAPDQLLIDPTSYAGRYLLANVWVMATVVLGYTGAPILRGAYVSLRTGRANMDLLVALAAVTAYVYSCVALLLGRVEVYFDVTVVIVLAVTIGTHYEERIRRRAAGKLADLTEQRVDDARRKTDGGTEQVSVDDLQSGDSVVVRPGERIPVDGTIREGRAAVDEALVTGESVPVERGPGDPAVGGAVATDGALVVEVGENAESTLDRLVDLLWEVRTTRPGAQRLADRIAAVFVPAVVVLAVVAGGVHLALGASPTGALLTGLAVLVVSCPCALGLATPLAVAAGVREALERGIVVADGSVFETATDVDAVALDKTGTLTAGRMELAGIHTPDRSGAPSASEVLERAGAVESFSNHPIAAAVRDGVDEPPGATEFERHPGRGVSAEVDGDRVVVGRRDLLSEREWTIPADLAERYDAAREEGDVPALVGWDDRARGVLVARDRPRAEYGAVLDRLAAGRRVVVITGDRGPAAERFRAHPAVDRVYADVAPDDKTAVVERLRESGTVAMVGDGANDAPALAAADLGIAVAGGTRLAGDAADAVVTTDDLAGVEATFDLTAATRRRIRTNLGWAFLYNAVAIPSAALGLISPLVAAVAMAASSLLVVANSARPMHTDAPLSDEGNASDARDPSSPDRAGGSTGPTSTGERGHEDDAGSRDGVAADGGPSADSGPSFDGNPQAGGGPPADDPA